jgi:CRISPR-associated exonuclease Cas4
MYGGDLLHDVVQSGFPPEEFISASELEKFGYCPLSWWYSREGAAEADLERLDGGKRDHAEMDEQFGLINKYESMSREAETTVAAFSVVATVIAIASLVVSLFVTREWSLATVSLALLWLLAASMFLYVSLKNTERAIKTRRTTGLGSGKIVDVGASGRNGEILVSASLGLRGLPDMVMRIDDDLIPVEVKTGRVPRGPLFSHILQLAAYCVLIEERQGRPPPYGVLQYGKHVRHEIDYNDELQEILLLKLDEMRKIIRTGQAHRNHHRPGKCASCSRREGCVERLA